MSELDLHLQRDHRRDFLDLREGDQVRPDSSALPGQHRGRQRPPAVVVAGIAAHEPADRPEPPVAEVKRSPMQADVIAAPEHAVPERAADGSPVGRELVFNAYAQVALVEMGIPIGVIGNGSGRKPQPLGPCQGAGEQQSAEQQEAFHGFS